MDFIFFMALLLCAHGFTTHFALRKIFLTVMIHDTGEIANCHHLSL